jgi:Zn-finger nucleic acid-binding protein
MSNCVSCGAALPPDSMVCSFCKTRNDIDLKGLYKHDTVKPESERICPRCDKPMQTIDLKVEGAYLIERCEDCFGLFFDPGELEALLDKTVANVYRIDYAQIDDLNKMKRSVDYAVAYIKCPVCGKLMNRINFGARSGVIVDTCKEHGIWLDGGELRQLMEWMKAGGQILHQQTELERERQKRMEVERKLREQAAVNPGANPTNYGSGFRNFSNSGFGDDGDLIGTITNILTRVFRVF